MRFISEQAFSSPPARVAAAYAGEALYRDLATALPLGRPDFLSREVAGDGAVRLAIRYHFAGDVSGAVRKVVDPARLSWVEESVHDLTTLASTFVLVPDHYASLLRTSGSVRYLPGPVGTVRLLEADVGVSVPIVRRSVERAIISGLRQHLADETAVVERFLGA